MAFVKITFRELSCIELLARVDHINENVCENGSFLDASPHRPNDYILVFDCANPITNNAPRDDLTAHEIATFTKAFLINAHNAFTSLTIF